MRSLTMMSIYPCRDSSMIIVTRFWGIYSMRLLTSLIPKRQSSFSQRLASMTLSRKSKY